MLEAFPGMTADALDYVWQNIPFHKLAGGTYALEMKIDGAPIYLVNGFHARQLQHFVQKGRCIVACTLRGDLDWSDARGNLIGSTLPTKAADGSIRKTLLEKKDALGLKAVTPSWNGVHLSAGPVEGLVELIRYQSNPAAGVQLTANDFQFGKQLIEKFGLQRASELISNPDVTHNGARISVFDLTEELNASEAVELLAQAE
jgi:hypothetical protein